jgi:UDP-glucose:(heptosyl)LPS alpha-1,3-glucosyltransferase
MKVAFCLFNYFPFGGLQRDFYRIATACQQLGHEVHIYTMAWQGDALPGAVTHLIKAKGWQNHTRISSFIQQVSRKLAAEPPALVVGFNKMPGLHVYYAADVCYQDRMMGKGRSLDRWLPRYQRYISFEKAVFERGADTQILLIAPKQQQAYSRYYGTEPERFHLLPPGISRDRMAPPDAAQIREQVRGQHQLRAGDHLLLMVGSGFKTKGLDRAIRGIAALPDALRHSVKLFVIGQDHPGSFQKLAHQLRVADRIQFLGGRSDVRDFMLAADLLVHPAYHENTGTVLLEALTAGLPVLTAATCGYAGYVSEANAGVVLPEPFNQSEYNATLQHILLDQQRSVWRENALAFSKHADIYSLPDKAAHLIHHLGQQRVSA